MEIKQFFFYVPPKNFFLQKLFLNLKNCSLLLFVFQIELIRKVFKDKVQSFFSYVNKKLKGPARKFVIK